MLLYIFYFHAWWSLFLILDIKVSVAADLCGTLPFDYFCSVPVTLFIFFSFFTACLHSRPLGKATLPFWCPIMMLQNGQDFFLVVLKIAQSTA